MDPPDRSATGKMPASLCGALGVLLLAVSYPAPAQSDDGSLRPRDTLSGDWGGIRTGLSDNGVDVTLTYIGEVFGNTSGGLEIGSSYEDLIRLDVDTDLGKLLGWAGGTAHVSVDQIDNGGRDAEDLVGALSDPSNIDARRRRGFTRFGCSRSSGISGTRGSGNLRPTTSS